jgi:hypothetical protein
MGGVRGSELRRILRYGGEGYTYHHIAGNMPRRRNKKNTKKVRVVENTVSAPGGPPIHIANASSACCEATSEKARYVEQLVEQSRSSVGRWKTTVSRSGAHLGVTIQEGAHHARTESSSKYNTSKLYRQCDAGKRLFLVASLVVAGKLDWSTQAVKEKAVAFRRMGVTTTDQLTAALLKSGCTNNVVIVEMLTNPDLPQYIINAVAKGMNPLAMVKKCLIRGPIDELRVDAGRRHTARTCINKVCMGPGPFSSKGLCIPCVQKLLPTDEVTMSDLVRFCTVYY